MTHGNWKVLDRHDEEGREAEHPNMSRMRQKTRPLRGKYVKKLPPVRRGIKQRRKRYMQW